MHTQFRKFLKISGRESEGRIPDRFRSSGKRHRVESIQIITLNSYKGLQTVLNAVIISLTPGILHPLHLRLKKMALRRDTNFHRI